MVNELKVQMIALKSLKGFSRNAKRHPPGQVKKIAASIKKYGFNNPILIDGNNTILAGHGRFLAAESLGLVMVPTISLRHMSPDQARAYVIADNKLGESGWDTETLLEELFDLTTEGVIPQDLGFSDRELEALFKKNEELSGEEEAKSKIAKAKDSKTPPKPRFNETWKFGKHTLVVVRDSYDCVNLFEKLRVMPDSMELIIPQRAAGLLLALNHAEGSPLAAHKV